MKRKHKRRRIRTSLPLIAIGLIKAPPTKRRKKH